MQPEMKIMPKIADNQEMLGREQADIFTTLHEIQHLGVLVS